MITSRTRAATTAPETMIGPVSIIRALKKKGNANGGSISTEYIALHTYLS